MNQPLIKHQTLAPEKNSHHNDFENHLFVSEATDFSLFIGRIAAVILLLALLPIFFAIAIAVKISSPGPVFYRQTRVGRFGKNFEILKFRTMVNGAEKLTGAVLATANDARITRLGRLLRATHLDEIPQLWNVAAGAMGFIGPRPERPIFVDKFKNEIPRYHERHLVIPGITGLAQILLPYDARPEEKLVLDLSYLNSRLDWKLKAQIFRATAVKMLRSLVPFLVRFGGTQDYRALLESLLMTMREGSFVRERSAGTVVQ